MLTRAGSLSILCLALLATTVAGEPMFPPIKGTVPDPPKSKATTQAPAELQPAQKAADSPAQIFLKLLRSSDATADQRRAAWDALLDGGKRPPQAVVAAVDRARQLAWRRLKALIVSPAVRKAAGGLLHKVVPHQARARAAIHGKGFTRKRLDAAMGPIEEALRAGTEALHALDTYAHTMALLNELETYATDAGLRVGWNEPLADVLASLLLVARYVGGSATTQLVAHNLAAAESIHPDEHACIARLNTHRLLLGIRPVEIDLRLVIACRKHSEEMVAKDYFSHTSPTPHLASFGQRAGREDTRAGGECIAAGSKRGGAAFRMWYYSQGHHTIMLAGTTIGVGRCNGKWTLMAGSSRLGGAAADTYTKYVRRRHAAGADADRLVQLARWCSSAGLHNQARDELDRALAIAPDHEQAKRTLSTLR